MTRISKCDELTNVTPHTPVGRPLRPQGKLLQEDARRHHRSLLLQQLFRDGPASRADLARASALTRVTVSDLVGEMLADGLVTELGAPAGSRVGKPPTLVGLAADSHHIIGLDLSETDRMSGAVVNLAGTVGGGERCWPATRCTSTAPWGSGPSSWSSASPTDLIAMTDRPVLGIGVGSPGVVDTAGTVIDAPNLAWTDTPARGPAGRRPRRSRSSSPTTPTPRCSASTPSASPATAA